MRNACVFENGRCHRRPLEQQLWLKIGWLATGSAGVSPAIVNWLEKNLWPEKKMHTYWAQWSLLYPKTFVLRKKSHSHFKNKGCCTINPFNCSADTRDSLMTHKRMSLLLLAYPQVVPIWTLNWKSRKSLWCKDVSGLCGSWLACHDVRMMADMFFERSNLLSALLSSSSVILVRGFRTCKCLELQ